MRPKQLLRIGKQDAKRVREGLPWVYVDGSDCQCDEGEIVELEGPRSGILGWGLFSKEPNGVRVLGLGECPDESFENWFTQVLFRADQFRSRIINDESNAYRVINGAGDGLDGLVLDRYGSVAVCRLYSKAWEPWLGAVVNGVKRLNWVSSFVRKLGVRKVDGKTGVEHLHGDPMPDVLTITENGMKLLVRPAVGQKTGLFLDQRYHREKVRSLSNGRLVCNLFSYTGGFSVAAALGGASQVTTVDISGDAIEDAKENFRLNGLDPGQHRFIKGDVFAWKDSIPSDLLILDPPNLSSARSDKGAALSAYRKLHKLYAPRVVRDGLFATSSCSSRLSFEDWFNCVEGELAHHGVWSCHWKSGAPMDHPVANGHTSGHYLKFGIFRRR